MNRSKLPMAFYAMLTMMLWAIGYVMTRIAVQHFTPGSMAFLRYFTASLSLILVASFRKMRLPKLHDVPLFLLGGAIGFAVYVYAINAGSRQLSASVVSFIVASSPVITALLAMLILKEKIGLTGWASVALAFLGVSLITLISGGFAVNTGVLWIVVASILNSFFIILQRRLLLRYSPMEITTYCITAGALELSIFAPGAFPELMTASCSQIIALVVLGVFSGGVAYLSWAKALSMAARTSNATNFLFLTPLLTTFLGFLMISEVPSPIVFVGGALILLGVLMINKNKRPSKPT